LVVSHGRIGDVLMAQGKLEEALKAYRDANAIAERLASADRSNARWQHDVALAHGKLASVYERQGRIADALHELLAAKDIIGALIAIAPSNAEWRNDLAWLEQEITRLQAQATAQ
jgi:tetratricopeptide (TPR) repeat protein